MPPVKAAREKTGEPPNPFYREGFGAIYCATTAVLRPADIRRLIGSSRANAYKGKESAINGRATVETTNTRPDLRTMDRISGRAYSLWPLRLRSPQGRRRGV